MSVSKHNRIRFYTTKQPAQESLNNIGDILRDMDAEEVTVSYKHKRVVGIRFQLQTEFGPTWFSLPVNIPGLRRRLEEYRKAKIIRTRITDEDRIERMALRCVEEWLRCHATLMESGQYTPAEAMFAFALRGDGRRLFDVAGEVLALPPPSG